MQQGPAASNEIDTEIKELKAKWDKAFGGDGERKAKIDLTPELLRRWFGDAMLQTAVPIKDVRRASVVDLLRILDYPNDFVPVLNRRAATSPVPVPQDAPTWEHVDVMDKNALSTRLARNYLSELMDRARIL